MSPKFQLIFAAVALAVAGVLWLAFLRPVPTEEGIGVIAAKTLAEARDYTRINTNTGRSEYHSEAIRTPKGYAFSVDLPDGRGQGTFFLAEKFGEPFQVGQRVKMTYQVRGLPPFWKRAFVLSMDPAGP